ncbi:MAG: hypothetical protein OEZ57_03345 [Nitrospirota bacterium]|nr:hypothetical protein [Nitrospirota bacterium]
MAPPLSKTPRLAKHTAQQIAHIYQKLDYQGLGPIYCDEGGDEFWEDRRGPCQKMGSAIAKALKIRLPPGGRSLYVGAGVPEIPPLLMEQLELNRTVCPYNLRQGEVDILNEAGGENGIPFIWGSAESATGTFDHLWIVSVLNDPEEFPNLSVLFSYGRADPLAFDVSAFSSERETGVRLFASCMEKLNKPGLLTTSVEELPWVEHWCATHDRTYYIEETTYPTALVGDPVCFVRIT